MCNIGMYLRGTCEEVVETTPLKYNFSTYSNDTFFQAVDNVYAAVDDVYAAPDDDYTTPEGITELLQITSNIHQKVHDVELMLISSSIDQRILMGDMVKETCPALPELNYTCPNVICSPYTVTLEWDYGRYQMAHNALVLVFFFLIWRKWRN